MLLTKQSPNEYTLIGDASEYKKVMKILMGEAERADFQQLAGKHTDFYQALLGASKEQQEPTKYVMSTSEELCSLVLMDTVEEKDRTALPQCLKDVAEQFKALEREQGRERVFFEYQGYLTVATYEMILSFLSSFDLKADEIEELAVGTYVERYEEINQKNIKGRMWDAVYSEFFMTFQELIPEENRILSFDELYTLLGEEIERAGLTHSERLWLYLFYLEVILKMLHEQILFQAEDKEMAFSWSKPYVLKFAEEIMKGKEEVDDLRKAFRSLYVDELCHALGDVRTVEADEREPYNAVFVLHDNKRVVSNTNKHFEQFIRDVNSGKRVVTEEGIRAFVRSITPRKPSDSQGWGELRWDDAKDSIYPVLRPLDTMSVESFCTPLQDSLAVFYAVELQGDGKRQLAWIMNKTMESWSLTQGEVKEIAFENLRKRSPEWGSYYKRVEGLIPNEQLVLLNKPYRETYMIQDRSPLNASYLLDGGKMDEFKKQWGSLIVAIPTTDSIFATNKEYADFLRVVARKLYESHPTKLSSDLFEWDGESWHIIEQGR